jgi:branched-chain amino acid transport system substrate-binding protein
MARKPDKNRFDRRTFIKASAATGTALAAGFVFAPAVRAAKTIKLGYVSPQTGPLAAFAEANNFIISNFRDAVKGGIKVSNATYPVEVVVKDSHSNPNRAAEVAKELIVGDNVMSRCLLNIAKRSLLRLMLSCVGLASKHVAG